MHEKGVINERREMRMGSKHDGKIRNKKKSEFKAPLTLWNLQWLVLKMLLCDVESEMQFLYAMHMQLFFPVLSMGNDLLRKKKECMMHDFSLYEDDSLYLILLLSPLFFIVKRNFYEYFSHIFKRIYCVDTNFKRAPFTLWFVSSCVKNSDIPKYDSQKCPRNFRAFIYENYFRFDRKFYGQLL